MFCPNCQNNTLKITQSLELPSDASNDEITLQTVRCDPCGFDALAVYRESRRGALDSESWIHEGYRVSQKDIQTIRKLIESCPSPNDKRCLCDAHKVLGHQTDYRWDGLETSNIKIKGVFVC